MPILSGTIHHFPVCEEDAQKESCYVKQKLFPLALVSALLLSTAVLAQGGGGGGGGGGVVLVLVEQVPVVPVEVVALAVLPAQAAHKSCRHDREQRHQSCSRQSEHQKYGPRPQWSEPAKREQPKSLTSSPLSASGKGAVGF